jgi:hypothetical protein
MEVNWIELCTASGQYIYKPSCNRNPLWSRSTDDHGLSTVNRFSIRGDRSGVVWRQSLNIPHQYLQITRPRPSVCIFCWQDRQETGRARVQRRSVIMSVHGTLIYACFFHVELKWITNTRLIYTDIHCSGRLSVNIVVTRRSRVLL